MYKVVFTKQALKYARKIASAGLKDKTQKLIEIIRKDPFKSQPSFEKLLGDISGAYSRRINIQHRFVYQVYEKEKVVKVIRMWTHYE